jgi:hypothetical protein
MVTVLALGEAGRQARKIRAAILYETSLARFLLLLCGTGTTVPPAFPVQEARLRAPGPRASLHRMGDAGSPGGHRWGAEGGSRQNVDVLAV